MKKAIAMLLLVCMLISLCACGNTTPDVEASAGGENTANSGGEVVSGKKVVNVGVPSGIPSLDPFFGADLGALYVNSEVYEYLFVSTEYGGELMPAIGKSYTEEVTADEMIINIELYDYVKDSAGNDITAEDVVFCYEKAKTEAINSSVNRLTSAKAIDDYHVELRFSEPVLGLWKNVSEAVWIVDKDTYDAATFATNPIATGPYKVKEFVSGSYVTLEKNENHWQTDASQLNPCYQQNIDEICYKIILESAQMTIALQTGDIDVACNIATTELGYFRDEGGNALDGYMVNSATSNMVNGMIFNCSAESVCNDIKLRQAICYAIDEAGLIQGAVGGEGERCHGWNNGMEIDWQEEFKSVPYYEYNLEKAKQLVAESSYAANGSPTLRIMHQTNEERGKAAVIIQGYLDAIGISSEILPYDAALFGTYKYEFDQWDILLDNQSGSFVASTYMAIDYTTWKDQEVSFNGLHDEVLQEKFLKASSPMENNKETVADYFNYFTENVYVYGMWVGKTYQVGISGIDSIYFSPKLFMVILPGAMEYAADYQSAASK